MLTRIFKRASKTLNRQFSIKGTKVYTWGDRALNLGHEDNSGTPVSISFKGAESIAMGKFHTLISNPDGEVFTCGLGSLGVDAADNFIEEPTKVTFFNKNNLRVTQIDCGKQHSIVVTSNGDVFTWGDSKLIPYAFSEFKSSKNPLGTFKTNSINTPTKVNFDTKISQVSAGDHFSVALSKDRSRVFAWGYGDVFVDKDIDFSLKPLELTEVNEFLAQKGTKVKKIKAEFDSVMILTDDGEMIGWGGNYYGQIGNNHHKLYINDREVFTPTPMVSNHKGKVVDFDLGENMCVFWTTKNLVYYCGRYQEFVPVEVKLPFPGTVNSVGANFAGFGVSTEEGKVYTFGEFLKTEKQFFDQGLFLVDKSNFGNGNVVSIGGSYDNKYAIVL